MFHMEHLDLYTLSIKVSDKISNWIPKNICGYIYLRTSGHIYHKFSMSI